MKRVLLIAGLMFTTVMANASVAFFFHVRVPDAVKDVKFFYFELANNGDTLFTEMNDKFGPGHVFSETAESRIRKGKMQYTVRYSKNGKKWVTEKIEIDVTGREASIQFYYQFGLNEKGKTIVSERNVYRINKADDQSKLVWIKSKSDMKDSTIHFINASDTSLHILGNERYGYGELFRRNESNLYAVEWKGVNADNPCRVLKSSYAVSSSDTVRISFPNLLCDETKANTKGKYQARVYVSRVAGANCSTPQEGNVVACIFDAYEYILQFDRK